MPTARKPLRTGDVVRYGKAKAQVRQPIVQNFPHPSTAKFVVEQYVVVEIVDTTTGLAASLYSIEENRYFTIVSSACIYLRVYVEAHAWGACTCDRDKTAAGRDSSRMAHG